MNPFLKLADLKEKELFKGFFARLIHTDRMTIAHLRIVAGSALPEHFHPQEQLTNILSGEFEMTVDGKTQVCTAGTSVVIPSNTPHSGRALTDCIAIDVFQPVREDYK